MVRVCIEVLSRVVESNCRRAPITYQTNNKSVGTCSEMKTKGFEFSVISGNPNFFLWWKNRFNDFYWNLFVSSEDGLYFAYHGNEIVDRLRCCFRQNMFEYGMGLSFLIFMFLREEGMLYHFCVPFARRRERLIQISVK